MPSRSENSPINLRMLLILESVAAAGVPVTPTDVNQELKLPKATIHRLFSTLEREGFLQRELDGRTYSIGRRFRRISTHALSSLRIRTARLSVLNSLAEKTGETCNIAIADREAMIYLDRIETKWPLRIQFPIGSRVPLYCTASGKLYLSSLVDNHLDRYLCSTQFKRMAKNTITEASALKKEIIQIRKDGYSFDNEEFIDGMIARAVRIDDDKGRLVSTLSVQAPIQRMSAEKTLDYLDDLRTAASELSQLIVS